MASRRGIDPPRGRARAAVRWAALVVLAALGVGAVAWWWLGRDPIESLRARASPVTTVLRAGAPDLGERFERWQIVVATGDTVHAVWRGAPPGGRPRWSVVVLGGLVTGEGAATLVPDDLPVDVLAVAWPWRGPTRMSRGEFLLRLPAIREALLCSPAAVAAAVEASARDRPDGRARVAIVGVSLGVPPAIASLRLGPAPGALVVVDGAADLERCLERELVPYSGARLAPIVAGVAFRLILPLEPALHADAAAGIPTLVVNSRRDERLPASCVARLHAGLPEAEVRWRDAPHIRPSQAESIAMLARESAAWLAALETR